MVSGKLAAPDHGRRSGPPGSSNRFTTEQIIRKIVATIGPDIPQAIALDRSLGFGAIGTACRHALVRGRYLDEVIAESWIDAGRK